MLNPAHILEIALLLLVAFLLGATIGSIARLVVLQLTRPHKVAPLAAVAATAVEAAPLLVTAPVIDDVAKSPTPTAPADVPTPDFTDALQALAGSKAGSPAAMPGIRMPSIPPLPAVEITKSALEMAPARSAGETTSGRAVAHPRAATEPPRAVPATGVTAAVIPFPLDKVATESSEEPAVAVVAPAPASEIKLPERADAPQAEANAEPGEKAANVPIEVASAAEIAAEVGIEAQDKHETSAESEVPSSPEAKVAPKGPALDTPAAAEGTTEPAEPVMPPPAEEPAPVAAPESNAEDDEAAAMRAIEGNWSPRRGAAVRARKAALPEAADEAVAASGAAVASAVQAASATIAEPAEAPGKPVGLPAPRLGVKDDLTHVIGILPIIETALNRLGLYHFDQIAELTDENAEWIENHLGIAGRVGREHWREQAQGLTTTAASTKKVAGK